MFKTENVLNLHIRYGTSIKWKPLLLMSSWHKVICIDTERYLYIVCMTNMGSKAVSQGDSLKQIRETFTRLFQTGR